MINFTPTLANTAVAKPAAAAAPDADGGKTQLAAGPAKTGTADAATGASGDAASGQTVFQRLLDAQSASAAEFPPTAALIPPSDPTAAEMLANLKADGDADPDSMQAPPGQKKTGKTDPTLPAAAAAGNDFAALIGAATGQIGIYPGNVQIASAATAAPAAAAKSASTDATTALTAALGNTTAATGGKASATASATPAAAADSEATGSQKDFAALQKAVQENVPLLTPQPVHASRDPAAASASASLPVSLVAAAPAQSSPAPVAAASIAVPVGAEGWDQALGQQVVWMTSQKNSTAEIHVNPPDLGPLSVSLNVADNTASASFVAPHAATREAIADAMPRLRDMLADAGISLGQVSVSAESFAQSGGSGAGAQYSARDSGGSSGSLAPGAAISAAAPAARVSRAQLGLVDTFA
jgi:flagellar hook-length control protein FliK